MARCGDHNKPEPCWYCGQGLPPFHNLEARVEYLERLVEELFEAREEFKHPEDKLSEQARQINRAIGVIREGGIGDLVMMVSGLKALKKKYPRRPLALVTRKENQDLFAEAPYLDLVLPLEYAEADFYRTIDLRYAVEPPEVNPAGKLRLKDYIEKDRSDIFDELMGVKSDKDFSLYLPDEVVQNMAQKLAGLPRPLVGLAPTSKQGLRDIPLDYAAPLARSLQEVSRGTVVLIGKTLKRHKGLAGIEGANIVNLIDQTTLMESMAAVSLLDFLVAPETGLLHVAAGFHVKSLLLSGCIAPECRVPYYPTVTPMSALGELPCIPCHAVPGFNRHAALPCRQPGQVVAECMRLLTPERITAKALEIWDFTDYDDVRPPDRITSPPVKAAFLHDKPLDYNGGAERSSQFLVDHGKDYGFDIDVFSMQNSIGEFNRLEEYDLLILSNIWGFNFERMDIILEACKTVPYVRYDHDYRSLDKLVVGKFPRPVVAKMFRRALLNIYVSPQHREDHEKVLRLKGGAVFPPAIDTEKYQPVPGIERTPRTALVPVPRKSARTTGYRPASDEGAELKKYMKTHQNLKFTVLKEKVSGEEMVKLYSEHEFVVHLPQGRWACDRVPFEAALCGCKVVTNENSGVLSWGKKWDTPGDIKALRNWLKTSPEVFWGHVKEAMEQHAYNRQVFPRPR
jgi:ADP-heptose:LPS heptosyltransferase